MLLFSLALALAGGLNPNLHLCRTDPVSYLRGWGIRALILFPLALVYAYVALPALTGPFWGLGGFLLICWAFNCAGTWLVNGIRQGQKDPHADRRALARRTIPPGIIIPAVFLLAILLRCVAGLETFAAGNYRALAGQVAVGDWPKEVKPVDLHHIRMVSEEQAEWLGNKVLGEAQGALGSRYRIGDYSIQRVQGELYWVAPLEFHGFSKWLTYGYTEGFVMVSAEDAQRKPRLVLGKKMRYLPSAHFGSNLLRHVYSHGYAATYLRDINFELDEDLQPYWVITLTHPAVEYSGEVVDGVLLVNPEDGAIKRYGRDEIPDWVDRTIPEELAGRDIRWWGEYPHGWWNAVWSKQDVMVPTQKPRKTEFMWLVWGSDDQPYWFTGMTSAAGTDQALTGIALVNSRTGQARYYALSGANEEAVIQAVNAAVSNYSGYHGTQPILYNIYGEPAWVVPVLSQEHIFQRLAIVRASNSAVVLGPDKESVLREFRKALTANPNAVTPGSEVKVTSLTVTLDRVTADVQNGTTVYYFYSKEYPHKLFTATSGIAPEVVLARPGDKVMLSFMETNEKVVPLTKLELPAIELRDKN